MSSVRAQVGLSAYTTLGLGGPARRLIDADSDEQIISAILAADRAREPVLVLGGGSNLVVGDDGFPGTVVRIASRGVTVGAAGGAQVRASLSGVCPADAGLSDPFPSGVCPADAGLAGASLSGFSPADAGLGGAALGASPADIARVDAAPIEGDSRGVAVTVAAGENWDRLVEWSVREGLAGLECMSGIPGLTGATPIQNVGAYGQDVSETITRVRAFDRQRGEVVVLTGAQCGFGYRTSMFKRAAAGTATGRFVVLEVSFRLRRQPRSAPVRYDELAARLGIAPGGAVPLAAARSAVLALRRGKGMVLDSADPDTRNAGSFFTNPVLTIARFDELRRRAADRCGPDTLVPHFPAGDGQVKVPAAWLIERAGFAKGYPGEGAARISTKHTLALTHPGGGNTATLLTLAREITAGVRAAFGVDLANEPVLVGVTL
jgi:UDP-N-acetylmuramate dehydrogenase